MNRPEAGGAGSSPRSAAPPEGGPRPHPPARATDPADHLLDILSGKYRVQAVSTLASLGVPDLLAEGGCRLAELADRLTCDADGLERLLRFNVGLGFLELTEPDHYRLSERGQVLRSERLGPLATFVGSPEQWDPWSRLRSSLGSDDAPTPFAATFGCELYEYLAKTPDAAERYDHAIDAFTREEAEELARTFDFATLTSLVDVGGGQGKLLHGVLPHWPHLEGTLFDLPHVIEGARACVPTELADRITLEPGDFFAALPAGHDGYILKHVLHNWDDERAVQLLSACAREIPAGGAVLVIEAILTPDNRFDLARVLDLEMGVLTPGRARRKPHLRRLFAQADLRVESVAPIGSSYLLVGRRR